MDHDFLNFVCFWTLTTAIMKVNEISWKKHAEYQSSTNCSLRQLKISQIRGSYICLYSIMVKLRSKYFWHTIHSKYDFLGHSFDQIWPKVFVYCFIIITTYKVNSVAIANIQWKTPFHLIVNLLLTRFAYHFENYIYHLPG